MQRKFCNCSDSCEREYTTQSAQGAVVIDRRSILLQPVIDRASGVMQNEPPFIAVDRRPVPAGPGRDNPGPAGAHASNVKTTSKNPSCKVHLATLFYE